MKKSYLNWFFILVILTIGSTNLNAQEGKKKVPKYCLVNLSFSIQNPRGDLDNRYGRNNTAGLGVEILGQNNFIYGVNFDYLFGNRVREDVLSNLRNSDGAIIGNNQSIAAIRLTQRGFNANILFGKLFPFNKNKPRSGLRVTVAGGILQHKIRIQQDPQSLVPQTTGEYRKGYDRLTNGFAATEFIGYQIVSPSKKINFILGLEFVQGLTQSQRDFNFDQRLQDNNQYFDILLGGKFAWTIPFEIGKDASEIYY